jgi:hypothetical protein
MFIRGSVAHMVSSIENTWNTETYASNVEL